MIVKLLTEHHLEFLSLKGGCRGSSESTLVKMPHCLKSHVAAQMSISISVMLTLMNRTSISKTLNFISDITSLMYGLNIVHKDDRHFKV